MMFRGLMLARLLLLSSAGSAAAQATPTGVAGAACTVEPRSLSAVTEIIGAGTGVGGTPDPIPYVKPEGAPAAEAVVAEVQATLFELAACVNAGDDLRVIAFFSDGYLRRFGGSLSLPRGGDQTSTPTPPDSREEILSITDVTMRTDGRIGALARFAQGAGDRPEMTGVFTFLRDRGRLLIDELQPVTGIAATPAAEVWTPVEGAHYSGVVVGTASALEMAEYVSGEPAQGAWLPTLRDIDALESRLPDYLAGQPQASGRIKTGLPGYTCQYGGVVVDARALIVVIAFYTREVGDWRRQIVFTMDGGDCFFHVVYEPASGQFRGFSVNGDA